MKKPCIVRSLTLLVAVRFILLPTIPLVRVEHMVIRVGSHEMGLEVQQESVIHPILFKALQNLQEGKTIILVLFVLWTSDY